MDIGPNDTTADLASLVLLVDPARKLNVFDRLRTMIAREYAVVLGHTDYKSFLESSHDTPHAAVSIHTDAAATYLDGWLEGFELDIERFDGHVAYPRMRTHGWFERELIPVLDEAYARIEETSSNGSARTPLERRTPVR